MLVLLFLLMVMMIFELGIVFFVNGGVYYWVCSVFGFCWGVWVLWMYWVNNVLWMFLVYILFGSMFGVFYFFELSFWGKIVIGIVLVLFIVVFNVVVLCLGKWLLNFGVLFKLFVVFVLGVGGLYFGWNYGFVNDFSLDFIVLFLLG